MRRLVTALALGPLLVVSACPTTREQPAPAPAPGHGPAAVAAPALTVISALTDDRLQGARRQLAGGDEAGAVAALDALLADLPESSPRRREVSCELATVFNNRAQRIFPRDPRLGERDLRQAHALCPTAPQIQANLTSLLVSRAAAEDRSGEEGRARAADLLREALLLDDARADAHALLGDILLVDDDPHAGLAHLRRAAALAPTEARIAARLAEAERTAAVEAGFKDNRHNHFVARFEGYAQERLAWSALDLLEQAYFSIGGKLNVFPAEPITVVIYTGDQYKQATSLPDWAAGSFDGKIRVREGSLAAERGQLEPLLRHEYTHAVVATLPGRLPAWMNEGLANHFEGEDGAAATAWVSRARGRGPLPGWEVLERPSFTSLADANEAALAYAMATGLVHALVDKRGEYSLQTLMSRLRSGEDFPTAFTNTYAVSPREHYDAWVDSL